MRSPTKYRIVHSCLFAGIMFSTIALRAQELPSDILFDKIAVPGTMRSSQISDIVQDKLGLIWFASECLYQYDGYQFRQFKELSDGGGKINPNDIHCLYYDSISNRLLLGTHRYGIVAYDYETDKLFPLHSTVQPPPVVHQITQTSDGTIWVGSHGTGLFYLENDSLKDSPETKKRSLYPLSLKGVGDELLIGESSWLYILKNREIIKKIPLEMEGKKLPRPTRLTAIELDKSGKIWVGTESQGVFVYSPEEKKFIRHFDPSQPPFFSRISEIKQDRDGLIWILTKASGAAVYSPSQDAFLKLTKDPLSKSSLSSDNCFSMIQDREGIVWLGATGDLNKYDRDQIRFTHIFHNPLSKLSLSDNMVRGLSEGSDGRIWIGTDGGIINILDLKKKSAERFKINLRKDSTNYVPLYFGELNTNTMLVATSLGLLQFDTRSNTITPYLPLWPITRGWSVRQVLVRNNRIYFISTGQLYVHDLVNHTTKKYSNFGDRIATNVTAIHLDDHDRLWLGLNRGISLFDEANEKFSFLPFRELTLPADRSLLLVLSLQQVGNKLYVATFNAGLFEIDISDVSRLPDPVRYTEEDGLASNTVYACLPDENGALWLSTNAGISKFEPAQKRFVTFRATEGLQDEEFNRLAYLKTKSGEMVFGGINGINIFNPGKILLKSDYITPTILYVSVNNPLEPKASFHKQLPGFSKQELDYDQNFVRFHFFVPSYQYPRRYKLLYKLENFEKEWTEASDENVVAYSNLQPGDYTFRVKTIGLDGEEKATELPITITPPFYKTWWFVLLAFFTISFLVFTIIRSYIRKAQNDRKRLEALLKIRTYEIERSKEELHILNQKKDLIFSILSHDLRSPLTTLKGFLGYLINHAGELSVEELTRHAINIKNSVTNSLDLIDNTLFWSLSQMGNIQYNPTNFHLAAVLEKLRGLYQLTADKKKIQINIVCDEDLMLHADENMVYVTLRNLVSNALKFSEEGKPVVIQCSKNAGFAEINVIDYGIGMSQDYLKKVLSMQQPMLKKGTSNEKGTGLGLLLCKKFIEMNKGDLSITSTENVGTTFTVILPLAIHQPVEVASQ